ncbi:class I SAM-dependent methyltransferase [Neotabrizicola shimadae]|uniref:Class I SAM-dependent methyltransferase n=1 Tax=Neotabrizicola shimadae TaxID=2807096 RepID=A0A8G0ZRT2_9RHOB|nr:class I SAM-dependent methyltransferase [Neotabrizicola shimadae]QYZ70246.1 class I SAM-dependent methyltransferase [Neotabrizicola shimadae]
MMQTRFLEGPAVRWPDEAPGPVRATSLRLRSFDHLLRQVWPVPQGLHAVDLGAGHGMFAARARRHGFRVTAVDARDRWTPAEAIAGAAPVTGQEDDPDLVWVKEDARDHDLAPYDVIFIIGLIYHLPLAAQLDLLSRCAGRPTVVDTEIFDAADPAARACERLSPAIGAGFDGAFMRETGNHWSAADLTDSFWPTQDAFLAMCAQAGCQSVAMVDPPYRSRFGPRRWFVLDGPE